MARLPPAGAVAAAAVLLATPARAIVLPANSTAAAAAPAAWHGESLRMTHYWDCSGQGCDAATLQPWDMSKFISPPGYGPQNPEDFGGPAYGETLWLTGAASDTLSVLLGDDHGCCGADPNDGGVGGCGRCLLVQNPEAVNANWTAVVMKKSRCPPWSNGCGPGQAHLDLAVPGFDNLQWSTANICGLRANTGFESQAASEVVGHWYDHCNTTAECEDLCDTIADPAMRRGCALFAKWGWRRGDPSAVRYVPVECPRAFVEHVAGQFDHQGPREVAASAASAAQATSVAVVDAAAAVPARMPAVVTDGGVAFVDVAAAVPAPRLSVLTDGARGDAELAPAAVAAAFLAPHWRGGGGGRRTFLAPALLQRGHALERHEASVCPWDEVLDPTSVGGSRDEVAGLSRAEEARGAEL